jgi:hypothetical protein
MLTKTNNVSLAPTFYVLSLDLEASRVLSNFTSRFQFLLHCRRRAYSYPVHASCYVTVLNACLVCCTIFWTKDAKSGHADIEMGSYHEGLVSTGFKSPGNSTLSAESSRIHLDTSIVSE